MRYSVSDTAQYGDLTRGRRIITEETRKEMKKFCERSERRRFAKEWILEARPTARYSTCAPTRRTAFD